MRHRYFLHKEQTLLEVKKVNIYLKNYVCMLYVLLLILVCFDIVYTFCPSTLPMCSPKLSRLGVEHFCAEMCYFEITVLPSLYHTVDTHFYIITYVCVNQR